MKLDLGRIPGKVGHYHQILKNTQDFREVWTKELKPMIIETLEYITKETHLEGKVEVKDQVENLEAVVYDLGRSSSGLSESMGDSGVRRTMIKSNGELIYQQLFNGKIMVMTINPHIEGYGEPKPPQMVEIITPEELKPGFILRHMEIFLGKITDWEDYDDDAPEEKRKSFQPIGFRSHLEDPED